MRWKINNEHFNFMFMLCVWHVQYKINLESFL